jgi:hypothetical protein
MVFGLPNSTIEWILRSPFAPVERVVEAGPGGPKSAMAGRKPDGIIGDSADKSGGARGRVGGQRKPRRQGEKRSDSAGNQAGRATAG